MAVSISKHPVLSDSLSPKIRSANHPTCTLIRPGFQWSSIEVTPSGSSSGFPLLYSYHVEDDSIFMRFMRDKKFHKEPIGELSVTIVFNTDSGPLLGSLYIYSAGYRSKKRGKSKFDDLVQLNLSRTSSSDGGLTVRKRKMSFDLDWDAATGSLEDSDWDAATGSLEDSDWDAATGSLAYSDWDAATGSLAYSDWDAATGSLEDFDPDLTEKYFGDRDFECKTPIEPSTEQFSGATSTLQDSPEDPFLELHAYRPLQFNSEQSELL